MALDAVAQQLDFSLGMFQSGALEREPDGAAEQIVGLLGADGLPYRRGGATYKSNAASGSSGLLSVADAYLVGGRRTVFQRAGDTQWRMLDVDDATPAQVPNPGSAYGTPAVPFRVPIVKGVMQLAYRGADWSAPRWWAGSRKTADYTTLGGAPGTMTVTRDEVVVTGVGTSWLANVDPGMFLGATTLSRVPVRSVDSDTQVTLAWPWDDITQGPGQAFRFFPLAAEGVFPDPTSPGLGAIPGPGPIQASVQGRWVWAVGDTLFAATNSRFNIVNTEEQVQFPGELRALAVLRDVLLVFSSAGVHALSGLAYPAIDPASGDPLWRDEVVNGDLIAWGHEGIAPWSGSLVVPALDNVYLMDSLGAPTPIGTRILDLYLSYVQAGYVPGVAEVFNGHYFLPILNPASSYAWVDTLVCKLSPSNSGNTFAWSQVTGDGASVAAFAERQTVPPLLLGASRLGTSRVLDCSAFFKPTGAVKNDASGNVIPCVVKTIDYPTGNSTSNFVHKVRLRYELTDAAADNPTISAVASIDGGAGGNTFALTGTAAEASQGEKVWRVNRHAKNVQFTFTVAGASASCKIKSVEVFVRHAGRQ